MDELKIKKRDGRIEEFNLDKLIISIGRAGVPLVESEKYAEMIKNWLISLTEKGAIESGRIRDKIIELLGKDFPIEADSFKTYKKTL